jgi:DNA-binding NarL/FixJ family response regulator
MSIRVLVCDDDPVMRAALRALLDKEPDVEVVGEAPGGTEALETARRVRPDVTLLSTSRMTLDGVRVPPQVISPDEEELVKVILLTAPHHDEAVRALSAGVRGVLSTGGSPHELLHAIRLVAAGDAFVAPPTISRFLQHVQLILHERKSVPPEELDTLTPRELQVLQLLARGRSNAEIAGELFLSDATVRSHVHHLLVKLGLRNRTQAVAFAYENGLMPSQSSVPQH